MNYIVYIYALTDPTKNDEIFYVGRTVRPKARLSKHIGDALVYSGAKHKRIAEMLNFGLKPQMRILATLDTPTHQEACQTEQAWIDFLGFTCNLMNVCSGNVGLSAGVRKIKWTPEMVSKLGTKSDPEVALEVGCSRDSVAEMRRALGISPCPQERPRMKLSEEIYSLIGKVPDSKIAQMLGVGKATIHRIRVEMGIEPYRHHCKETKEKKRQERLKRIEENKSKPRYQSRGNRPKPVQIPAGWNRISLGDEIMVQLGTMPDYKLAEIAGVSKKVIARVRKEMGIASYAAMNEDKGQFKKGMPHPRWSKSINARIFTEDRKNT